MKIGILTYHSSHNYGAFLQAYSLAAFLNEKMGLKAEIINYSLRKAEIVNEKLVVFSLKNLKRWWILKKRYEVFQESRKTNPYISTDSLVSDEIEDFNKFIDSCGYDAIITGSDEIWKLDGYRGFPNAYWLPNISNVKKIAFAPSSRTAIDKINAQTRELVNQYLSNYSYIGVRDNITKVLLENITGGKYDISINCDPTFLYDFNCDKLGAKAEICKYYRINSKKKTIALMCGIPELANIIIEKYKKKYNIICLYEYYNGACSCRKMPNPFEWMKLIAGSDGLITTFYHGLVFSVKNRTPFIAIENREMDDPAYSKSYDFLSRNQVDKHFYLFKADRIQECMKRIDSYLKSIDEENFICDYGLIEANEKMLSESFIEYLKKDIN